MCKKKQFKYCPSSIDECMKDCISTLGAMSMSSQIKVVACCCGHGIYPITIIVKNSQGTVWDLLTGTIIPRKKKFYKKDKEGYYYIPEVSGKHGS